MKNNTLYRTLTIPVILYLASFLLYPFLYAVFTSFTQPFLAPELSFVVERAGFIPFSNYKNIFSDSLFILSVRNNLIIAIISILIEITIGIALAVMVNSLKKHSLLFTCLVLIPFIIPEIVFLTSVRFILAEHGYINGLLNLFRIEPVYWLKPGSIWSIFLIAFIDAWRMTPLVFLIILGALKNMPVELIESAQIEGANDRQILFSIILPLLSPAVIAAVLLRSVDALRIFAAPMVLSGVEGAPVMSSYAYYQWAYNNSPKLACATSVILAFIVLASSAIYIRLWRQSQELQI